MITLTECPRDAMQGIHDFIPTNEKINYLNDLLAIGFSVLDFGSFVSPKSIPQLADTFHVVEKLNVPDKTKLLAIIANERGAKDACEFEEISYLGFPFSISETFQQRNTNASRAEALERIRIIQELAVNANKELVVYLSMGFGNPYGDSYSPLEVDKWSKELVSLEIHHIILADTIGVSAPPIISSLFETLIPAYPSVSFGAHFHSKPTDWKKKMDAAWAAGCTRFDSAMNGIGGCPMADDVLVGNIATENVKSFFELQLGVNLDLNESAFMEAQARATYLFGKYS